MADTLRYMSVCSGIEAASVAWEPLGWRPVAFSEIEPFPCAVLAHHWPQVPNHGDMTKFQEWPDHAIDLLCGGTPCQSFSVAGLRKGLADPRGNLMLTFGAIAGRYRPRWLVWENVPGVLSSNGGRDFGAFLGMLGQLGYGVAYRVLDAQYVRTRRFPRAVPQRRRRVFVVGYLGDWRRAAAVLFDRESLSGNPPPRREAGQGAAADVAPSLVSSGRGVERIGETRGQDPVVACFWNGEQVTQTLDAVLHKGQTMPEKNRFPAVLQARNDNAPQGGDGTGRGVTTIVVHGTQDPLNQTERGFPLGRNHGQENAVLAPAMAVRRLTPRECERLQGFPDDHTLVPIRGKPAADGPRYKAIGNSWAVNVASWVGERIAEVDTWTDQ